MQLTICRRLPLHATASMTTTRLQLETTSIAAIDAAAQKMQSESPFAAASNEYSLELPRFIAPSLLRMLAEAQAASAPLSGRFARWELCGAELRLLCTLDSLDAALGMPSVCIGSVADIALELRPAFLSEVNHAFPLTDASTFRCVLPEAEQLLLTPATAPATASRLPPRSAGPADGPAAAPAAMAAILSKAGPAVKVRPGPAKAPATKKNAAKAPPCHFFLKGACKKGAACRFSHSTDGKTARPVATPREAEKTKTARSSCSLAPMDVSTGVTGAAKIQKRRPRARRGPASGRANRESAA